MAKTCRSSVDVLVGCCSAVDAGGSGGYETMRNVGAQGESGTHSRSRRWSGTRMASVQTIERRLRFSMVVIFSMAIWIELMVMPPENIKKRPLLERSDRKGVSSGRAYSPMRTPQ